MSATEVANSINDALLEPLLAYEPIESECELLRHSLEDNPEVLEVSVHRVYNNLTHLKKYKAPGPDGLSNWVLKEYAEFLVQPVQNILNASYNEQKLPLAWKMVARSNGRERVNCAGPSFRLPESLRLHRPQSLDWQTQRDQYSQ